MVYVFATSLNDYRVSAATFDMNGQYPDMRVRVVNSVEPASDSRVASTRGQR